MKKYIVFVLIISIFRTLNSANVDSLETSKRHYYLDGIRVIADRQQETIGAVNILGFDTTKLRPEINIAETVDKMNGLHVSSGGKSGSSLRIRGFNNDQVKILLDGRPLCGGYFGNIDLNTIPNSDIKEIRILKGPVSSIYGSNTLGGVVNIITETPKNGALLKIGTEFQRNSTNKSYISSNHDLGKWDYWLYVSRYQTDGFSLSKDFLPTINEDGKLRDNTSRDQWDFQSKFDFTVWDFHSIGFQAGYTFMDNKEIPSSIYESRVRKFTDWKRYQASTLGFFQLKHNLTLESNIFYDRYDDTYAEYNPATGEMFGQWPSFIKSWIYGTHIKFDWELFSYLHNSFGYRFENQEYTRKDNANYPDWLGNEQIQHYCFWQSEYTLNSMIFTAGSGMSFFKPAGISNWNLHWEPSAGIHYSNSKNWKYSLAYSSNTKYPSMHQLFSDSSGNPALIAERAEKNEFNLHIPVFLGSLTGSIQNSLYYNHITNLIDKVSGTYQNLDKIDTYGFEISLTFFALWEHQIEYSHLKYMKNSSTPLLETPENSVNLKENIKLPFATDLEYDLSWVDKRFTDEGVILPGYWLNSVYLRNKFNNFKILFGLENIFDIDYQEEFGYPGKGLNFIIRLETEFF
ncbi:MAG: TonB-dependent receptor plug domain-containing protein [Candidatus Cloacimonetes bacterium]|nr:TonB-dependent receptor plug domain-containing protein [Candidatus Cloacimonadota bacterium]